MFQLFSLSRYIVIPAASIYVDEANVSVTWLQPQTEGCEPPPCDGNYEPIRVDVRLTRELQNIPPPRCGTYVWPVVFSGTGIVWKGRNGKFVPGGSTSIHIVGDNLIEVSCFSPVEGECPPDVIHQLDLQTAAQSLATVWAIARSRTGNLQDFVLTREAVLFPPGRTFQIIPGVPITSGQTCVEIPSSVVEPVFTCPSCGPEFYYPVGVAQGADTREFPNIPEGDSAVTILDFPLSASTRTTVNQLSGITGQNACRQRTGNVFVNPNQPSNWSQFRFVNVVTNNSRPRVEQVPVVPFERFTNTINCVAGTGRFNYETTYRTRTNISVGSVSTTGPGYLINTLVNYRTDQGNDTVQRNVTQTSLRLRNDATGDIILEIDGAPVESNIPTMGVPEECSSGSAKAIIEVAVTLGARVTIRVPVRVRRPDGSTYDTTTDFVIPLSLTSPAIYTLGPQCFDIAALGGISAVGSILGGNIQGLLSIPGRDDISFPVPLLGLNIANILTVGLQVTIRYL